MALQKSLQFVAGDFRFPVEVQRPDYVPDGSGGQKTAWLTAIPVVFCAVTNKQGSEPYSDQGSGRVRTFQKFLFTTWYGVDIRQTDRLFFQGLYYNIRQVNNLNLLNKFLQIEADAGVEQ
jgi:head-tail adaptor